MTASIVIFALTGALAAHPLLLAAGALAALAVPLRRWLQARAGFALLCAAVIAACALGDLRAQLVTSDGPASPVGAPILLYPLVAAFPALHALLPR